MQKTQLEKGLEYEVMNYFFNEGCEAVTAQTIAAEACQPKEDILSALHRLHADGKMWNHSNLWKPYSLPKEGDF
jgi:hypothetical protein